MKDFVKTMLAVVCGYIVLRIIGFLFFMILIGSAFATGGGSVSLPRRGVLDMDLSAFTIAEQTQDMTASTSSQPPLWLPQRHEGPQQGACYR